MGVRSDDALARSGRTVRLYMPYGDVWCRYWRRRVAEAAGT